jgi:hypothetical protein
MTEQIQTESKVPKLSGIKDLLMGPAGTGKTHSIGTLVDAGLEVFYVDLENGLESLIGYYTDNGKQLPENLHWFKIGQPKSGISALLDSARRVNTLSYETLCKAVDPNRASYNQYLLFLSALGKFVDDRTGNEFGAVNEWDANRVLVIDGMTQLANICIKNMVGGKPAYAQNEWGVSQNQLMDLLTFLCNQCNCHVVVLAHVDREVDQISGGTKLMVSSLGKALYSKLPSLFSDVILSVREGAKWTWDTSTPLADIKTRNLPIRSGLEPSFQPVIDRWRSRSKGMEDIS